MEKAEKDGEGKNMRDVEKERQAIKVGLFKETRSAMGMLMNYGNYCNHVYFFEWMVICGVYNIKYYIGHSYILVHWLVKGASCDQK